MSSSSSTNLHHLIQLPSNGASVFIHVDGTSDVVGNDVAISFYTEDTEDGAYPVEADTIDFIHETSNTFSTLMPFLLRALDRYPSASRDNQESALSLALQCIPMEEAEPSGSTKVIALEASQSPVMVCQASEAQAGDPNRVFSHTSRYSKTADRLKVDLTYPLEEILEFCRNHPSGYTSRGGAKPGRALEMLLKRPLEFQASLPPDVLELIPTTGGDSISLLGHGGSPVRLITPSLYALTLKMELNKVPYEAWTS